MVLRNWYNTWKSTHAQKVIPGGLTAQSGSVVNAGYNSHMQAITGLALTAKRVVPDDSVAGILLGSGTTPPTIDDYKMESLISSGFSTTVGVSLDDNNDAVHIITVTNTSDGDIVVGEVGYSGVAYSGAGSGMYIVLMDRTVLDSPVTIPAGGVGKITYTIRMNYPTA